MINLHKALLATTIVISSASLAHADAPLALTLSHDTQALSQDGVYRTEHFQEQYIRTDNTVWVARILPAGLHNQHDHNAGSDAHKDLDVATATRYISKDGKGVVSLKLIETHDHDVVDIPKTEYEAVGFDGNWANAYYLVDPTRIKTFKPLSQPAPQGAKWYENKNAQSYVRVLWSEQQKYPLLVESGSQDGHMKRIMKTTPAAIPAQLPWQQLANYHKKEYTDFLD